MIPFIFICKLTNDNNYANYIIYSYCNFQDLAIENKIEH